MQQYENNETIIMKQYKNNDTVFEWFKTFTTFFPV